MSKLSRRQLMAATGAALLSPSSIVAQQRSPEFWAQWNLVFGQGDDFITSLGYFLENPRPEFVSGLILAMRFSRQPQEMISGLLQEITGEADISEWADWMLWQERNPQIVPHETFEPFKRTVLMALDPSFEVFLKPEFLQRDRMTIRFEEVTWGGVRKDGIPSLDGPRMINAVDADYLQPDDLVFGVEINGDIRAYPLRIMGWHEMFNDVIGGVPVALAYCTLCGSGILFETGRDGQEDFVFGSSGFLYRSNKLMFDRQTHSLWNQFTGKPVIGPLVSSGVELQQRPVVIDTWQNWSTANPETTVLDLNTGYLRDYGSGVVYSEYFSSPDLMFPVQVDQSIHLQKDYVFGVRTFGAAKAWPLDVFEGGRVINDNIAGQPLVLIGDQATRSVRAYQRDDFEFLADSVSLRSKDGAHWVIAEDALTRDDGTRLPRVPGHVAYWFAWNGYFGEIAELYSE